MFGFLSIIIGVGLIFLSQTHPLEGYRLLGATIGLILALIGTAMFTAHLIKTDRDKLNQ